MAIKATPTAEGFGRFAKGGRDGLVLFLNDLTDATHKAAWEATYDRIIIPRVSGYVEMAGRFNVSYGSRGDFTYLGMLSPSETVYKNWEIRMTSIQNFIIRGLKSRAGDRNKEVSTTSGDAFTATKFSTEAATSNFFIDHSVGSWGTDEIFSLGACIDGTVQYCLFYEPLHLATINEKGSPHGYGHIFGAKNISIHHNLHAYMDQRMPLLQNNDELVDDIMDFRNNAYYGWNTKVFTVSPDNKSVNIQKNSFLRKTGYSGFTATAMVRFAGTTSIDSPRIYLYGNTFKTPSGGSFVDVISGLTDATASQKLGLVAEAGGATTTALRDIVGVLTPFTIPVGTYSFDETVAQSDLAISLKAGTWYRDPIDLRVLQDWQTGVVSIQGGTTGIFGLVDKPEDSVHLNGTDYGYPIIPSGTQILDGSAPHYLPSWFITKYSLVDYSNYHLAGTPITRSENFIIFGKADQGIQLSQYGGAVDYDNDLIYRGYEVIAFHETNEIDLLESPTYTLTVDQTTGGTTNILGGEFASSSLVTLIAVPDENYVFTRWEQFIIGVWTTIAGATSTHNFLMPSSNTSVRPIFTFEEPPIPPIATGEKFFAKFD